jgi:hypothetical protein
MDAGPTADERFRDGSRSYDSNVIVDAVAR